MSILVAHAPARLAEPTEGRGRLRLLDRVLNELEEESERGETTVSDDLAKRAGCLVAGIVPDALIRDAIDLVFLEQERTLAPSGSDSLHLSSRRKEPKVFAAPDTSLESGEARTLTERIRQRLGNLSLLLLQAHDRRAWSALGYRTWEAYVQDELGLSRSRSYELLQHGRVMTALHVAGITAGVTEINPYCASQLEPYLTETIADIKQRLHPDMADSKIKQVVRDVIAKRRMQAVHVAAEARDAHPVIGRAVPHEQQSIGLVDRLRQVAQSVLELPSDLDLFAAIDETDADTLSAVQVAAERMADIARQLARRRSRQLAEAS
jgi:hypothetical protein